ncbi:outer membrane lipoprotein carrier protein [Aeromonas sp. RU39B]|jgi:outer membrane lipoprotein carrier protein|uniref:outer membrane lipoprotein chaperone LolA n=1 Tax=Aeromonas sp. RU39B TaxID=1907416 RepID=UPI000956654C|nr:outer membrane lipoprotein chaperone LolA [Aeromonas sp. RU39B]SIQ22796.1 outer membrane lipoprotein carrier protein [Aeromonas sp. RU39B]
MKKAIAVGALMLLASTQAFANGAADQLKQKLAGVKLFSAHFEQTVYDVKGQQLQKASGELTVSRPNRFNWHTTVPDESLIISDGKDVWLWDPFVEQATAMTLKDAVVNTPFILISGNDDRFWKEYDVSRQGDVFTVTSRKPSELIASFQVTFDRDDNISRFDVKEAQGQWSEFHLSKFNRQPVLKGNEFTFTLPKGAELDDQRR